MNIAVMAYLDCNLGDDLMLDILFKKYNNHTFYLLGGSNKNYLKNKYSNVVFIRSRELCKYIFKLQGIVIIGGSLFQDYKEGYKSYNLRNAIFKWFKILKKKVCIMGANIGPIYSEQCMEIFKKTFEYSNYISVRDKKSYEILKENNIENCNCYPDIVFNYQDNNSMEDIDRNRLGISIINYCRNTEHKQEYIDKMVELINKYLIDHEGKTVYLFGFDSGAENDGEVIDIIMEKVIAKNRVNRVIYNGNIDEFLECFKKCSFIIGTRFHSIILALKYQIPFIPIMYSIKTENLLDDINYSNSRYNYNSMKEFNIEEIINTIDACESFKVNEEYIKLSKGHFNYLDSILINEKLL